MLEQLAKVDGVKTAMANHAGSHVRVALSDDADSDAVAEELTTILNKEGRKPKPVTGNELVTLIESEKWRDSERIGELSEIEFRTVFARRVKQFTEQGDFTEDVTAKLIKFSEEVLADTPATTTETDWGEFCGGLASQMLEKAKEILTEQQLEDLRKKLEARVIG